MNSNKLLNIQLNKSQTSCAAPRLIESSAYDIQKLRLTFQLDETKAKSIVSGSSISRSCKPLKFKYVRSYQFPAKHKIAMTSMLLQHNTHSNKFYGRAKSVLHILCILCTCAENLSDTSSAYFTARKEIYSPSCCLATTAACFFSLTR